MKILALAMLGFAALFPSRLHALTAEEQAVLAPVLAMFDGMTSRDAAAIKATWLAGGTLVLMRDGKPSQMTFEAFADRIGKPGKTRSRRRFMTRRSVSTTIWRSYGLRSTSWSMARWTTAEPIYSTLCARMASG